MKFLDILTLASEVTWKGIPLLLPALGGRVRFVSLVWTGNSSVLVKGGAAENYFCITLFCPSQLVVM